MHYFDLGIILVYLVGITWFGSRFHKEHGSLKEYFLGGRTAPWWAISLSIVAAETSTLTIVGTPVLAFTGNMGFLQIVLGYLLARIVISVLLLPHYFRGEMFTAYELMRRRFGERIRKLTAGVFLMSRSLAEGVRVFAAATVISVILGTGEVWSIVLITLLTLFYTLKGGMTAVIWTEVAQMLLYVAGAIISFFVLLHQTPGGWAHIAAVTAPLGKLTIFDFHFAPTMAFFSQKYTFLAGILGGCFLTTATHGTDQLMVQWLLSGRNEKQSRNALLASWVVIAFQFVLFLLIGLALFVYYQDHKMAAPVLIDRIYPDFLWNHLPPGLAGLSIAAILAASMANLGAALNSLSSTTVVDFLKIKSLKRAHWATAVWAGVLLAIGIASRHSKSVLEVGLTIASIPLGGLLGVFLLGILTKKPREGAAIAGIICGLTTVVLVHFRTPIAWTWYVMIGTVTTFTMGIVASWFEPRRDV